jgi:hypothetical protein
VQLGADIDRVRRVDRAVAFLNVLDLSLLIHNERGAVRKLELIVQDAVLLRDLPRHVAQQRKLHSDFLGEGLVGGRSVNADAKYRGVFQVDLAGVDTSLVCLKFFRSTTGKGKDVECQYYVLFAAIVGQFHRVSFIAAQGEVRRHVADFQKCVSDFRLRLLSLGTGKSENRGKK